MKNVCLESPSAQTFNSYLDALHEGFVRGIAKPKTEAEIDAIAADPAAYIADMNAPPHGTYTTPSGHVIQKVPGETLWLCEDNVFIGEVNLRHRLNDFLMMMGGHVGYGVRPSLMNKGYATHGLLLTRVRAGARGIAYLLVTCDPENIASERVILKNGGVFEDTRANPYGYSPSKRFWVPSTIGQA